MRMQSIEQLRLYPQQLILGGRSHQYVINIVIKMSIRKLLANSRQDSGHIPFAYGWITRKGLDDLPTIGITVTSRKVFDQKQPCIQILHLPLHRGSQPLCKLQKGFLSPLENSHKGLCRSSHFYGLNQRCHAPFLALVEHKRVKCNLPVKISKIARTQQLISSNPTPGILLTQCSILRYNSACQLSPFGFKDVVFNRLKKNTSQTPDIIGWQYISIKNSKHLHYFNRPQPIFSNLIPEIHQGFP
ncbi:hypothetical protein DUI87_02251 [Hirundo rustica rustica]|uniref:Uncharacterized protein n=1 Tax=Hirundo rustica rustica TaxID=333673 RepID=A0A3M0L7N5_HIRRU|nr:hypothetical protein DUI87_02251 [Hirundo rustica rustica]